MQEQNKQEPRRSRPREAVPKYSGFLFHRKMHAEKARAGLEAALVGVLVP